MSTRRQNGDLAVIRCLLINVESVDFPVKTAPLALATLGGVLKKQVANVSIDYFDEQLEGLPALRRLLLGSKYGVIGISAQSGSARSLWPIMNIVSELGGDTTVIVGNVTATYGSSDILDRYPNVLVCVGRGEETLVTLVTSGMRSRGAIELGSIPNIEWRDEIGETQRSAQRSLPDLFEAAADWEGLLSTYDTERYDEFWIEASRGCPQKRNNVGCTYCAILPDAGSRDWAPRSIETVQADARSLVDHGVRHLRFADEEFMANQPVRAEEFANAIAPVLRRADGWQCTFDVAMRVDDVVRQNPSHDRASRRFLLNGEVLSSNQIRENALIALRDAGMRQVYLGVESGSTRQLRRMRKGVTVEGNQRGIGLLRKLGVQVACGWIMFDPFMEDPRELLENSAFIRAMGLLPLSLASDFVTNPINRMRALEGAPLVGQLESSGLLGRRMESLVEYEFRYSNPVIDAVVMALKDWSEDIPVSAIYRAKSKVSHVSLHGREMSREEQEYCSVFFALKALDLEACDALASQAAELGSIDDGRSLRVPSAIKERQARLSTWLVGVDGPSRC